MKIKFSIASDDASFIIYQLLNAFNISESKDKAEFMLFGSSEYSQNFEATIKEITHQKDKRARKSVLRLALKSVNESSIYMQSKMVLKIPARLGSCSGRVFGTLIASWECAMFYDLFDANFIALNQIIAKSLSRVPDASLRSAFRRIIEQKVAKFSKSLTSADKKLIKSALAAYSGR